MPNPSASRRTPPTFLLPDVPTNTPMRSAYPARPNRSRPSAAPRRAERPYRDPTLPHDTNFSWDSEAQTVEELASRAGMGDLTAITHAKRRFGREAARRVATAAGYATDAQWAMLGL